MPSNMEKQVSAAESEFNLDKDIYSVGQNTKRVKKGRPASGSSVDRRRKVHLKCEHRRRKEIQEALDSLVAELPSTAKARSKAAIIVDSAEMISELTFTLDRLLNENKLLLNRKQVEELTK